MKFRHITIGATVPTSFPKSWNPTAVKILEEQGVTNIELLRLLTPRQIETMDKMGPARATEIMDLCGRQGAALLHPSDSLKRRMDDVFGSPGKVPMIYLYCCGILNKPQYNTLMPNKVPTLHQLTVNIRQDPQRWQSITGGWPSITRLKVEGLLKDIGLLRN